MSFNFAPTANQAPAIELIPAGTSVLALIAVNEVKRSANTGCLQAKIEFTVARGPFERRKVWMYIGDPNDANISEKWKPMCLASLQHMLESAGIFNPADPATYTRYATVPAEHAFTTILQDLEGKHVAAKLKIEKGKDGNDDRNVINTFLSPNPNGRTAKAYADVQAGADVNGPAAPASAGTGFGAVGTNGATVTPAASAGGFAATAAAPPAAANTQPATAGAAPAWLQQ